MLSGVDQEEIWCPTHLTRVLVLHNVPSSATPGRTNQDLGPVQTIYQERDRELYSGYEL